MMNTHIPITQLQQLVTHEQYYHLYTSTPSAFSLWIILKQIPEPQSLLFHP